MSSVATEEAWRVVDCSGHCAKIVVESRKRLCRSQFSPDRCTAGWRRSIVPHLLITWMVASASRRRRLHHRSHPGSVLRGFRLGVEHWMEYSIHSPDRESLAALKPPVQAIVSGRFLNEVRPLCGRCGWVCRRCVLRLERWIFVERISLHVLRERTLRALNSKWNFLQYHFL